ncbi:Predicted lipoprotein with conserved Yx(FWY)xxD motif [Roseateles sp. YR242]|uniref:COG4315 family predicted lipoprotein n=1 Tax=Roseateles sp. YR242 TaxID=1855305 RepID=UPI0008D0D1A5|nr:hypothetical protein [Roseateles sp. YR242]SEK95619.1 Predicted lipoprotein with conserved Yx(FWY)xxD motif [Roseateles sp. YR242]
MKASLKLLATMATTLALTAGSGLALAQQAPAMVKDGVLVGHNEKTLYTFDKDSDGKSACNGPCAKNWPPLAAKADDIASGDWAIITRDDGAKQWAYKGKPLYFWVKDLKPGDRTGDGVNQVWHAAKP